MATGLLFECDEFVAQWLYQQMGWPGYKYDRAVGLVNEKGALIGAVLYQHWNGCNVEVSYYGKRTMSAGIIRTLARFTLIAFNPGRITVNTSKKNKRFIRSLYRFGFRLEGACKCYYGPEDTNRNTAIRFVGFRDDIARVAKLRDIEHADESAAAGNHPIDE